MWYFLLYCLTVVIWIACVNRYYKDHEDHESEWDDLSDREAAIGAGVVWPLTIVVILGISIIYGIYKGIYYVVDKIYTKFVQKGKRSNAKTKKDVKRIELTRIDLD